MEPTKKIAGRSYVLVENPEGGPKIKALVIGRAVRQGNTTYDLLISKIEVGKEEGTEKVYDIDPGRIHPVREQYRNLL